MFELSHRILSVSTRRIVPTPRFLRLGLCPRDWLVGDEAVGVNALKAANAFVKALKAEMTARSGRVRLPANWKPPSAKAPPSNAANAQAFAASPLGARDCQPPRRSGPYLPDLLSTGPRARMRLKSPRSKSRP